MKLGSSGESGTNISVGPRDKRCLIRELLPIFRGDPQCTVINIARESQDQSWAGNTMKVCKHGKENNIAYYLHFRSWAGI